MNQATQLQLAAIQTASEDQRQYLTFLLGGEMFALPIHHIKEIIEYGSLTEVPMMPDFIRGVINLRGSVVPVIDLSARFCRSPTEVSRRTCIVIIEVAGAENETSQDVGVMVDSVCEVLEIPKSEIEPPPAFGTAIRTDFISGMGKVGGKFVIILEANKVLAMEEMAEISRMDRGAVAAAALTE